MTGLSEKTNFNLAEIMPSLDNFLSFGKEGFIQRKDYQHMVLEIAAMVMNNEDSGEADYVRGCLVLEAMLLNLVGHMDDVSVF